jgi:hypothetical protein
VTKIILDLCGGTGSWSKPYKEAGYDVRVITLPDYDVTTFEPSENIYGIFAAPPCTMFSMARTTAKTPRDLEAGMDTVKHCLRIVWKAQYKGKRLSFWALENPKALLRWFLGKPALTFNPYDYGDAYRKPTDLWGNFNEPKKKAANMTEEQIAKAKINNQDLRPLPQGYVLPDGFSSRAARRSMTHEGFAQAFYEANK